MTDETLQDEHGEYSPDRGSSEPPNADELDYEPCGAVLKYTYSRYGEKRYCTGMAVGNFPSPNYEHDEYCKHHQNRAVLEDPFEGGEAFKHGAYVRSYEDLYDYLPPHKQIMAIDLYKSLLEESTFSDEWETETIVREVESTDTFGEGSSVHTDFPVPTEHRSRAAALWFASIDFIKMQNINEEQFRVAFEETGPRGEPLTVGEDVFEKETESGEKVEVKDEHHLNLPLSRIQKDYERHLKMGGVSLDAGEDDSIAVAESRDWVLEVEEPEADAEAVATTDG